MRFSTVMTSHGNNQIDTSNITKLKNTMRITFLTLLTSMVLLAAGNQAHAQRYVANDGFVRFFSGAAIEDIEATNEKTQSIFDAATGDIAFIIPIKEFVFDKNLMRQHFNENYMESEMYPESTFSGKIIEEVNFTQDGSYQVRTKGTLLIHGVEQSRIIKSKIDIKNGTIKVTSSFAVPLEDHDITIPKVVNQKIATEIRVQGSATFQNNP